MTGPKAPPAHTPGPWVLYCQPVSTPDDAKKWLCDAVDESVKAGTFQPHLYGVGAGDMAKDLGWLIVAQTGCGPTSEANAAFIADAPETAAVRDELAGLLRAVQPLLILAHSKAINSQDAEGVKIHGDTLDAISTALAKVRQS